MTVLLFQLRRRSSLATDSLWMRLSIILQFLSRGFGRSDVQKALELEKENTGSDEPEGTLEPSPGPRGFHFIMRFLKGDYYAD